MSTTIDLMEYSSDANAQAAYVTNAVLGYDTNIYNDEMTDISSWTDGDTGTGDSSQVTFDSKSCMKLLTAAVTTDDAAVRTQDVGTFGNRTVISFSLYCDLIGTQASSDCFTFFAYNGTRRFLIQMASDGLFNYNAGWAEVGTNLVIQDTWQEWTFDINWVAYTVDIYLAKVLQVSNLPFTLTSATANGTITLQQQGLITANQVSYVDWIKVGDSLYSFQSYSEATIKTQGSYALKGIATTDALNKTLTRTIS